LLDVFDVPDGIASTPQRNVTTTPLQSLLMMNNPWMIERARVLAARVNQGSPDDAAIAQSLFQRLLARPPSDDERNKVAEFIQATMQRHSESGDAGRQAALIDLCHVLLNANEFLFVH